METDLHLRWLAIKASLGLHHNFPLRYQGKGITIGILDSGCPKSTTNKEYTANPIHQHLNFTRDNDEFDKLGHGTQMDSIVKSTHGISPLVSVKHFKIDTFNEQASFQNLLAALKYISDQTIYSKDTPDILLMAMQDHNVYKSEEEITQKYAEISGVLNQLNKCGIILIASSGNHYAKGHGMSFPAIQKSCISVTAGNHSLINRCNHYSSILTSANFSLDPNCLTDIIAPGVAIPCCSLDNYKTTTSGTSPAAALAASCIAVLKEAYHTLNSKTSFNNQLVRRIIKEANTLHEYNDIAKLNQINLPNCIEVLKSHFVQNPKYQSNESHQANRVKFSQM